MALNVKDVTENVTYTVNAFKTFFLPFRMVYTVHTAPRVAGMRGGVIFVHPPDDLAW